MIKKIYRLRENEVKKVLKFSKPFFSYWCVLNHIKSNLDHNRFAIVLSWKSVKSSVERNFFRRKFYNLVKDFIKNDLTLKSWYYDLVFVVKKQTILDKKDSKIIKSFEDDIKFLLKKVILK